MKIKTVAGEIELYAYRDAPKGWLRCNGQILSCSEHVPLQKAIGFAYGGNGTATFALPNLPPLAPAGPYYYICLGEAPEQGVPDNRIIGRIGVFAFRSPVIGCALCDGTALHLGPTMQGEPSYEVQAPALVLLRDIYPDDYLYNIKLPLLPPITPNGPYYFLCKSRITGPPATESGFENGLGEIRWFPTDAAPGQWAKCDGRILKLQENIRLFSIIGTAYGGDERTAFALPNLPPLTPAGPFPYICVHGAFPVHA